MVCAKNYVQKSCYIYGLTDINCEVTFGLLGMLGMPFYVMHHYQQPPVSVFVRYIISGRYVNEQSLYSNCSMAECFPEKSSRCQNEHACQRVKCKALPMDWILRYIRTYFFHNN